MSAVVFASPRRGLRLRMMVAAVPPLLLLAWAAGFAWFLQVAAAAPPPPPRADGIVALTGGADRVETALRLLAEGRGPVLLISGVGGSAAFRDLARLAGVDSALAPRVTLGRMAVSTRGNAAETAAWARAHRIRSLIVVTASYHMPRALAELSRTLPDVALHPAPVRSPELPTLRLLASEYTKWLVSRLGLSGLAWRDDPAVDAAAAGTGAGRPLAAAGERMGG